MNLAPEHIAALERAIQEFADGLRIAVAEELRRQLAERIRSARKPAARPPPTPAPAPPIVRPIAPAPPPAPRTAPALALRSRRPHEAPKVDLQALIFGGASSPGAPIGAGVVPAARPDPIASALDAVDQADRAGLLVENWCREERCKTEHLHKPGDDCEISNFQKPHKKGRKVDHRRVEADGSIRPTKREQRRLDAAARRAAKEAARGAPAPAPEDFAIRVLDDAGSPTREFQELTAATLRPAPAEGDPAPAEEWNKSAEVS